ncbi:MAG: beta-hydroxyacyl-ACP dehydratase [Verrucomicrobiales bacterium]|nr:beta-hydroxyacyl-ACP dehydratase [Verrucomicrobiales bacterium]
MSLASALASLPHGPEFRFIDALDSLEPGVHATARYTLPATAPWLPGHFPGHPLMPGVLMIEAVAQLAGVVAQSDPSLPPLADLRLTAVRQAKILGTLPPGESLRIEAEIQGRLAGLIQAQGRVIHFATGATLLQTQITLSGSPASGAAET